MMTRTMTTATLSSRPAAPDDTASQRASARGDRSATRIRSIDCLRGLVMFTMIFVNDVAGARHIPHWMKHFHGKDGMTFVDLVFPAFLFIVGMSVPFAVGSRLAKGEPAWKVALHVLARTATLLWLGVFMVNDPDSAAMGWSATGWNLWAYVCAILACCQFRLPERFGKLTTHLINAAARLAGWGGLLWLALAYRSKDGGRLLAFSPSFTLDHEWWGILGLIGWAYLVASVVYLLFRTHRVALVACVALLYCLYPAGQNGLFDDYWIAEHVSIGEALGSHAAISVAGILLASVLLTPETGTFWRRVRFTLLFAAACAAAAVLLRPEYRINKNEATPPWCLWASAITAALWLVLYLLADVWRVGLVSKPLEIAGRNVLLAYLLSGLVWPVTDLLGMDWYGRLGTGPTWVACTRSAALGVLLLAITAGLNRAGFRLKL